MFRNLGRETDIFPDCGYDLPDPVQLLHRKLFADHPRLSQMRQGHVGDLFQAQFLQILGVDPVQFVDIKHCRILCHMVQGKQRDQFLAGENLLLAGRRPAKQRQEVYHGRRQISQRLVLIDRCRAVALAHFAAIFTQNQRNVAECRQGQAQRLVDQDLAGRIRQMFFGPNDMGDFHQGIVQHYGVIVYRQTIGLDDHIIADSVGIKTDRPANGVMEGNVLILRHPEANRWFAAGSDQFLFLHRTEIPAFSHVPGRLTLRHQCLSLGFKLLVGAIATIGFAARQQPLRILRIDGQAFGLPVGAMVAADIDSFIPFDPEPAERRLDIFLRFATRAFQIGVFDPQNQLAAVAPGQQPVEQRRTGAADVEWTGRARRKPNPKFFL